VTLEICGIIERAGSAVTGGKPQRGGVPADGAELVRA
jgi:hypothetical protein